MSEKELPPFETLEEYAEAMSGCEFGETLQALIDIKRAAKLHLSDEFAAAVARELQFQLKNCQENSVVVEHTETVTTTRKRIEWW